VALQLGLHVVIATRMSCASTAIAEILPDNSAKGVAILTSRKSRSVLGRRLSSVVWRPFPDVVSNKDLSYSRKPDRVFILGSTSGTFLKFGEVSSAFRDKWQSLGVTVAMRQQEAVFQDGMTLEEAIRLFRPRKSSNSRQSPRQVVESCINRVSAFTLDIGVTDALTKKLVWRAQLRFGEGGQLSSSAYERGSQETANRFVDVLTAKLKADGLLRCCDLSSRWRAWQAYCAPACQRSQLDLTWKD